jgi:hypothetical protein
MVQIGDMSYNANHFARLLGYFVSEGNLHKWANTHEGKYKINLSQNKGPVLDDMCGIIDSLKLSYNLCFSREIQGTININDRNLYKWLDKHIGHGSKNKNLPPEVFQWSTKAKTELFNSLIEGDGTTDKRPGRSSKTYYTTSEQLANDVQVLALSLGYSAKIKETKQSKNSFNPTGTIFRVHISGNKDNIQTRLVYNKHVSIEKYEGVIYCYNVPNHLFVTRRNGKVTIQGNTANRATAQTLSRQLVDSVKDIQDALEAQWNHQVIQELLLESTFGEDVLEEENIVHLNFAEIDIQNKIEQEDHALKLWGENAITWDELRSITNREPIPVPEQGEDQDPDKYPEWFNTRWKLFLEPEKLISAVDEPFSQAAQAAAEARSSAMTERGRQEAVSAQEKREAEDRKAKAAKPVVKKDSFLSEAFSELEQDIKVFAQESIQSIGRVDEDRLLAHSRTWAAHIASQMNTKAIVKLIKGFNDQTGGLSGEASQSIIIARNIIVDRIDRLVNKLAVQTIQLISRRVEQLPQSGKISQVLNEYKSEIHIAFDATRFRTDFIWDVELSKAYNYGKLLGLQHLGYRQIDVTAADDSCERCQAFAKDPKDIGLLTIDQIIPLHAGCKCKMNPKE